MPKVNPRERLSVNTAKRLLREAKSVYKQCRVKDNMRDSVAALLRVTEAERDLVAAKALEKESGEQVQTLSPAEATAQLRAMVEGAPAGVQHQIMQDIRARVPHWMNEEEEAD